VSAELGHFALWLALAVSLVQALGGLVGATRGDGAWMRTGFNAANAQFVLVTLAFVTLAASFVNNDFTVVNVANNSNSKLPIEYRFAASWGSHEGSLLMWALMLAGWTAAVNTLGTALPPVVRARVIGVLGLVAIGFLAFMLFTSNPFLRQFPPPPDGRDLNPLLQDPGMVIHPPMLYMGYVGFSVAFAFAVAALIGGNLDAQWARWTRPWTTAAWIFLTLGIALGSWWAYYELGWGGWWFWDPVENASFMPWLVGTALIHSLAVTEKRGAFKAWTVLLAISAFSLSLLGTFLVRSGVLSSVHAFATDPKRGLFILAFLAVVIGASLALYAWRAPKVGLGARFEPLSREGFLLANNVLLVVATAAVLLGTLYPLLLDALDLGKISVGPPYFDTVFVPLMAPLVFLMGVGTLARWKHAELPDLAKRLRWAAAVAVLCAIGAELAEGRISWMGGLGLVMGFWVFASVATDLWERMRPAGGVQGSLLHRFNQIPRALKGMMLAHLGIGVFIIGVTMVRTYEVERDLNMDVGQSAEIAGYTFTFQGVRDVEGPNYRAAQGLVVLSKNGKELAQLRPEKRVYRVQQNPMTEAAIRSRTMGDIYVSLGQATEGTAWVVRLYYKPFVTWIWGGCVLMALGGLLAAADRRYRTARREQTAGAAPGGVAAA
jgi:cytochrome c-type biogenesis protein CcmF